MKRILIFLSLLLMAFPAWAQYTAKLLFTTTNSPTIVSNIIKSLATGVVSQASITDARFTSSIGKITSTSNTFSAPILASGTNYTERIENTNTSDLILSAGGISLKLQSGSIVTDAAGGWNGNGNGLTNLNASQLTSGTVPTAVLTNIVSHGSTIYGDARQTNAVFIYAGGEILSNAVGSVTITGGAITNSGPVFTSGTNWATKVRIGNPGEDGAALNVQGTIKANGAGTCVFPAAAIASINIGGFGGAVIASSGGQTLLTLPTSGQSSFNTGLVVTNGVLTVTNGNNTGTIPIGQVLYTNLTGNITMAGWNGIQAGLSNPWRMMATNNSGGDLSVTFPSGCVVPVNGINGAGTLVFWATNNCTTLFSGAIELGQTNIGATTLKRAL